MKFSKILLICVVLIVSLWPCPVPADELCVVHKRTNDRVEIIWMNGTIIVCDSLIHETGSLRHQIKKY